MAWDLATPNPSTGDPTALPIKVATMDVDCIALLPTVMAGLKDDDGGEVGGKVVALNTSEEFVLLSKKVGVVVLNCSVKFLLMTSASHLESMRLNTRDDPS